MFKTAEEKEKEKVYEEAHQGNYDFVCQKIAEDESCITREDSNGRLILHWACLSTNEELVQYLLDKGSPVSHRDDIGMTPLILGASAGRVRICHMLISKGANVNEKNNEGHSALQYAASKGWNEIVKMLLINHADINIADKRGATPLHRAASKGITPVLKVLLDFSKQIQIDARDFYGNTPLNGYLPISIPAKCGLYEAIRFLTAKDILDEGRQVKTGFDYTVIVSGIDSTDNDCSRNRHLSCEENRVEETKQLITHGAKLDIKNKEGDTPLDLAGVELKRVIKTLCGNQDVLLKH